MLRTVTEPALEEILSSPKSFELVGSKSAPLDVNRPRA
jgi:hypothetical protein